MNFLSLRYFQTKSPAISFSSNVKWKNGNKKEAFKYYNASMHGWNEEKMEGQVNIAFGFLALHRRFYRNNAEETLDYVDKMLLNATNEYKNKKAIKNAVNCAREKIWDSRWHSEKKGHKRFFYFDANDSCKTFDDETLGFEDIKIS